MSEVDGNPSPLPFCTAQKTDAAEIRSLIKHKFTGANMIYPRCLELRLASAAKCSSRIHPPFRCLVHTYSTKQTHKKPGLEIHPLAKGAAEVSAAISEITRTRTQAVRIPQKAQTPRRETERKEDLAT